MAIHCLFGHKWEGCRCSRCGQLRDEQHNWDGCTCTRCGKEHDFDSRKVCTICGARLVVETEDVVVYKNCTGCPSGSGYGCTGDTLTCINADDYRTLEEVTRTYILYPDGTKRRYG